MRTQIFFKDVRRSDYIEDFINEKVGRVIEKLVDPGNDVNVAVRIEKARQRTAFRRGLFQCEVL